MLELTDGESTIFVKPNEANDYIAKGWVLIM